VKNRKQGPQRRGPKRLVGLPGLPKPPAVRESANPADWRVVDVALGADGRVDVVEIESGTAPNVVKRRLVCPRGVLDEMAKLDPMARLMGAVTAELLGGLLAPPSQRKDRLATAGMGVVVDKLTEGRDMAGRKRGPSLWDQAFHVSKGPQKDKATAVSGAAGPAPASNTPPDDEGGPR